MVDIPTFLRSADTFQKPQRSEYRHYFNGANFTMYFLEELRAKKMGDEKLAANAKNKYNMAVARLQAAAEIDIDPIYDERGELSKVKVRVHNKRCGHALPTSLTNIRQMGLEVLATDENGKTLVKSGYIIPDGEKKGSLDENTYVFNSDGMGHDMTLKNDPWEIVSFSRHDVIPPKGYRDVYYTTMGDHKTHDVTFRTKLRFRVADQKIANKLLTHLPKGFDLDEIYGLKEVPELPVVDMIDKTVKFSTNGKPSKAPTQHRGENVKTAADAFYDELGGEEAVNKVVDLFYDKVMADPAVNYFFAGIDMDTQRRMQKAFMNFAFGGSLPYNGRDLTAAHARLVKDKGLKDSHFDIIIKHFGDALREKGVKAEMIAVAVRVAESVRVDVLGRR